LARGVPLATAVFVLTCFNLANGGSRLVVGFLSDRVGRRPVLCAGSLCAGAAYLALPGAETLGATAALAAVVGVAFGTLFTVSAPLAVECFGPAHFGAVLGLVFTAYGYFSGLLGPWLSGVLLDRAGGDPTVPCLYLGALCFASALLVLGVRPPSSPGNPRGEAGARAGVGGEQEGRKRGAGRAGREEVRRGVDVYHLEGGRRVRKMTGSKTSQDIGGERARLVYTPPPPRRCR
jgi:MFS family permease